MGREVPPERFGPGDRRRYREKVKLCLDVLRELLDAGRFETGRRTVGLELEFYVVDRDGVPMMVNEQLLERLESADFQTELAQFNIEFNLAPHRLTGRVFAELEEELTTSLTYVQQRAGELDARVVMIGILPTVEDLHVTLENLSRNPRYHLLNEQILAARGEDLTIRIEGVEALDTETSSIAYEAAATSMQLHLQVDPDRFARYWNAAQALAGAQVAVGCNSPFFLGKQLWQETRIALFEQSIDTRSEELAAQGVRPRVWFGERWISSVLDLFEENVRYFPALLPLLSDEDPREVLAHGGVPHLYELTLHNGTIYRWNRPVYAVARGRPHLRVENRVLPAGPTIVDEVANAAFFFGAVHTLAEAEHPIEEAMAFEVASANFAAAARDGIDATLSWPGVGSVAAHELVPEVLLPLAHSGLTELGVDPADRDRYLDIIAARCRLRRTGASWQTAVFQRLLDAGLDRRDALRELTRRYIELMTAGAPVHTWPVD